MIKNEWYKRELQDSEEAVFHRPIEDEYSFYEAVKSGDMDYVQNNCDSGMFLNPDGMGLLSHNALTNIKYHFVVATAMITRYCIEGGMETEQAYRLSDFYILKMDSLSTLEDIAALHDTMSKDFTGKMLLLRKSSIISKSVLMCTDYIYNHLNERITIADLASLTNLSPSYISRLFKQNLGISISDYIREKKIEKAQNLLRYSDISYIDIANYLAFSSQSHFIQIFEKLVGITPKKYRDKYYHATW